jgi:hypothetical protein
VSVPVRNLSNRFTADGQKMQYEDLNSKSQIPNNKQYPNSNFQFPKRKLLPIAFSSFGSLEFGIYLEFGACDLEFKSYEYLYSILRTEPLAIATPYSDDLLSSLSPIAYRL